MATVDCVLTLAPAIAGDTAASVCDGVSCGMGTCNELPPLLPGVSNVSTYECDCHPGWSRLVPILSSSPCYIPTCPSDPSCYSPTIKMPPVGSNVTLHPCLVMDCGPEGTCVEEQDKPLRCQCNSGATNMLNDPSLPCTKNCVIGKDGCPVKDPPPPTPAPQSAAAPPSSSSTARPENGQDSPGPTRLRPAPKAIQKNSVWPAGFNMEADEAEVLDVPVKFSVDNNGVNYISENEEFVPVAIDLTDVLYVGTQQSCNVPKGMQVPVDIMSDDEDAFFYPC
ncbi:hypothetical protein ACQ4PT_030151 [Festuca glaucescens]